MAKAAFGKGAAPAKGANPFAKKDGGNPFAKKGADAEAPPFKKGGRVKKAKGGSMKNC